MAVDTSPLNSISSAAVQRPKFYCIIWAKGAQGRTFNVYFKKVIASTEKSSRTIERPTVKLLLARIKDKGGRKCTKVLHLIM